MHTFEEVKKIKAILKLLETETDNIVKVEIATIFDKEPKGEEILYYETLSDEKFDNLKLLHGRINIDKEGLKESFEIFIYEKELRIFCEFEDISIAEYFKENKKLRDILWMFYDCDYKTLTKGTYKKLLKGIVNLF